MRRLTAITLCNTAGQFGYVANQNMFNMFRNNDDPEEKSTIDNATMVTQTVAAVNVGVSMLDNLFAATTNAAIPSEVAMATQLLLANQTAIMQQMTVTVFTPPLAQRNTFHVPPIQHGPIPGQHTGGFQQGRGGQRGVSRGDRGRGCGGQGNGTQTPFANHKRDLGGWQQVPGQMVPNVVSIPQFPGTSANPDIFAPAQTPRRPEFSNPMKQIANSNVCFMCGFDVEDGHTLATCPADWRKPNHQEGFACESAQSYINAGCAPCMKGMHQNVLPMYT